MARWPICLILGLGVLLAEGLYLGSVSRPPAKGGYKFLQCPTCRLELAYNPVLVSRPCPRCGPRATAPLVPASDSIAQGGRVMSPRERYAVLGLIDLTLLLGALWFVLARPAAEGQEEAMVSGRCPGCRKKLRYPARSVGHTGKCPSCKLTFTFPASDREPAGRSLPSPSGSQPLL